MTPNNSTHNILLTGATGIVGSNVLYELLKQKINGNSKGRILLMIRSSKHESAEDRLSKILSKKNTPDYLSVFDLQELRNQVDIIDHDFSSEENTYLDGVLSEVNNLFIIHSAASTNLSPTPHARLENEEVNFDSTKRLIENLKHKTSKVIYISTAYACGIREGIIHDEYSEYHSLIFRNPYEEIKYKTERYIEEFCAFNSIKHQILRPGVVIGRQMEAPYFHLPKYNVIYGFASFFHQLVKKGIKDKVNIKINSNAALHLIPVDYTAKAIVKAYKNDDITEMNIVPRIGYGKKYVKQLLEAVGFTNYSFVEQTLEPTNVAEKVYQSKVASSFGPYITDAYYEYDNTQLLTLMNGTPLPKLNDSFKKMITYAKDQDFIKSI